MVKEEDPKWIISKRKTVELRKGKTREGDGEVLAGFVLLVIHSYTAHDY